MRIPPCARMRVSVGQAKLKRLFAEILVWGLASGLALAASASLFIAARPSKPGSSSSDDLRLSGGGIPPDLTFACDRPTSELLSLLSQPGVISDLTSLHAGIALDVPNLNVDCAQLVRQLNQAGIPVTAWLALPKEQGYYLNASNAPQAAAHFADFEKWSAANGLRWAAVGLDIDPSLQEFGMLKQAGKWRLISTLAQRYFDVARVRRAKMPTLRSSPDQADGYRVQTYQFPSIADEGALNTTLLAALRHSRSEKRSGSPHDLHQLQPRPRLSLDLGLRSRRPGNRSRSTFGSDSEPHFVPLNGEEFSRDLKVANHGPHDDTDGDTYDRIPRCRSPAISRVGRTLPVRRL